MKMMTRISALMLALLMAVVLLAACGDKADTPSTRPESTELVDTSDLTTWGEISVYVPENMHLVGGNGAIDPEDPKTLWLYDNDNAMLYIKISIIDSEESGEDNVELTRSVNEEYNPVDVVETNLSGTWKGVSYDYNGTPCTTCYGTVEGKVFMILTYGYDFTESSTLSTILSLIK